jgi:hypothetical protein
MGMLLHPAGTDIYHFRETFMPIQVLFQTPGLFISFTGALGLALLLVRPSAERRLIPVIWAAALLAMLAIFGYLYRVLAFGYFGAFYAIFTPSALMASLSCPLCIAGGWYIAGRTGFFRFRVYSVLIAMGLFVLFHFINGLALMSGKGFPIVEFLKVIRLPLIPMVFLLIIWLAENKGRRLAGSVLFVLFALVLFIIAGIGTIGQINKIRSLIGPQDSVDLREFKNLIPVDAIVINRPSDFDWNIYGWLPYWTWSECTYLVLPSTEQRHSKELEYKRKILQLDVLEAQVQANVQARPLVLLTPPEADYTQYGYKIIYESMRRRIQLYEP